MAWPTAKLMRGHLAEVSVQKLLGRKVVMAGQDMNKYNFRFVTIPALGFASRVRLHYSSMLKN